jgi:hypothetical protein
MLTAALFTIAKLWKQPRCPTTDEWIKKMWYLNTMDFYSTIKKNTILSFAGKWMELENIILSNVSEAQKAKATCSSHMWIVDLKQMHQYYENQVTLDRLCKGLIGQGEKNQKLECG